jgi:hypothetical protein
MASSIEISFDSLAMQATVMRYWKGLDLTLVEVFGVSSDVAIEYRARIETAPASERLLSFHASPLQIAADLTETETISEQQLKIYRAKVLPAMNSGYEIRDPDPIVAPLYEAVDTSSSSRQELFRPSDHGSLLSRLRRLSRRAARKLLG